jgi:AraC-like DNA-binding protein
MELVSNHSFPRHTHDEYRIGVVLAGAQRSWSGRGQVESVPGDVITVNPGELHDGLAISGAVRRWRIIYFSPGVLMKEFVPDAAREVEFAHPSLHDPLLGRDVSRLFDLLTGEADRLGAEEIMVGVVARLVSSEHASPNETKRPTPPIAKAKAHIDEDPARQIMLSDLAALADASRYQIVRAFARELGVTPHAYIVQRRARVARQLLLAGEPLATAALRAGFADQSHMTRAFVRQFGVTPGRSLAARN